jgi:hypothetical protein
LRPKSWPTNDKALAPAVAGAYSAAMKRIRLHLSAQGAALLVLAGAFSVAVSANQPAAYPISKSPASWLKPGPKWDLEPQGSHELYDSGHLYQAAYAHFRATGKRTLRAGRGSS